LSAIERKKAEELHWHKSCYAKYTDKVNMSRLRKLLDSANTKPSPPEINVNDLIAAEGKYHPNC